MSYKIDDEIVYGNNALGSKEIFQQRKKYEELYPTDFGFPRSFNFWDGDNLYYGRTDQYKRIIFPDESYLKQVSETSDQVFVLNFVADAFRDFQQFMKIRIRKKFVEDDFITSPWRATRGWTDVHQRHNDLMTSAYTNFAGSYLDLTGKHKEIRDYNGFLDIFFNNYLSSLVRDAPFTKTGLIRSKYSSPMMSGICVEIAGFDHSSDYEKYDKLVNNINFKTYLLAAAKFGFMVDQNAPWRLVANLESDNMRSYISKYMIKYSLQGTTSVNYTNARTSHSHDYNLDEFGNGWTELVADPDPQAPVTYHRHRVENYRIISEESVTYDKTNDIGLGPHSHFLATEPEESFTLDDIYNRFFHKADQYDIDLINVYLKQFYNTYVTAFPSVAVPKLVSCNTSSPFSDYGTTLNTRIATVFRDPISEAQHEEKYSDLFWTKMYFIIRLRETGATIDEPKLKKNLEKISKIYNFVDKDAALGYINEYLKQFY